LLFTVSSVTNNHDELSLTDTVIPEYVFKKYIKFCTTRKQPRTYVTTFCINNVLPRPNRVNQ